MFLVINKNLPEGKNTLQNVINTFDEKGDLVATRIMPYFMIQKDAIKKLASLGLRAGGSIEIVPVVRNLRSDALDQK